MESAVLAQRLVDAFNARDEEGLRELYHPDARIKRPTWPGEGDVQASLDSIRLDFGTYPKTVGSRFGRPLSGIQTIKTPERQRIR